MSTPAAPSVRHWQICGGNGANPISGPDHEAYTLLGSEDTTIELELDLGYCIIFKVGNTGNMSASGDYQWQYEINGTGGFQNVVGLGSFVIMTATGDADGATSTTEQLGTSAENYVGSILKETAPGLQALNISGGDEYEFYFSFFLDSTDFTEGGESIRFRLTTGGATFDHTAVEPIIVTLPSLSVPPAAYIPVPKANRVEFKRLLITPPHPAEYPQPAPPAVSVAAETPALKASRVGFKRRLQTLELNEYPQPIVTRVTHLTAAVLFDVPAPTVRITHLTTMVLYGFPRSHDVAETNAKAMQAFKVSFKRSIQALAHNPDYPETPIPPVSAAAETPALTANKTAFERALQPIAHNPDYEITPPGFFEGQWPASLMLRPFEIEYERSLKQLPELDEYPATPPVSVAAETPALTANQAAFERELQPIAHNPDYPETPAPPTPYIKTVLIRAIKRRDIKRKHLQAPPPTPRPLTTRVTHLTAAVLFDVPPPTVRITHLTAMVLYGRSTSADVPETNAKAMQAFKVEFTRALQTLPEIDEYPATPPSPVPYMAFTPALKVIISEFKRELAKLPELDEYEVTPPRFFEGFWPASLTLRPFEIEAERERQDVLNPHVYPPTPAGFFDGFYPGSKAVESFRISFDRSRQLFDHDEYPPPPISTAPVVAFQLPPTFTWQFKRTVQGVELDERPPTPPGFFEGFFPAPIRLKRIPSAYHREAQQPLELNERPPTPAGYFDGFWPGSKRVEAFRVYFDRKHRLVLEIDVYPITPVSAEDYPGLTPVLKANTSDFKRQRQTLELNEYPQTPAGFRWPRPAPLTLQAAFERRLQTLPIAYPPVVVPPVPYAAYTPALTANTAVFTRSLQALPIPPEYPPAVIPDVPYAAYTPALISFHVSFRRTRKKLPELLTDPQTPPGFRWPRPPMPTFRVEFRRELAKLPQHDQWTPTPVGFFDGQYPAPFRVNPITIGFDRSRQTVSIPSFPAAVPYPAYLAVPTLRRRATVFKAFAPPLLQLSRVFPPSTIVGDARWNVPVIYRRDIKRTIQPVWKPAAIIGEAFRDIDPECKWWADCQPVLWNAEISLTTWLADPKNDWDADCE